MPTDFLLRTLEWKRLLTVITANREGGGYSEAREKIEKACLRVIGLSFNLIKRYSPEALLELMHRTTDASQKSIFLAELLIEYAKISEAEGKTADEIGSTLQAFCLLRECIETLPADEEAPCRSKLDILGKRLSAFRDNPYIKERILERPGTKRGDFL